jgi:hypothetical protein
VIRAAKSANSAQGSLKNLIQNAPFVITKILTDDGKELTIASAPLVRGYRPVIMCLIKFVPLIALNIT